VKFAGLVILALAALIPAARAASAPVSKESSAAEERLDAAVSRCVELAELVACAAALSMKPNDPRLLVAEGDALVRSRRPGEAIGVYRNAVKWGAVQDEVGPKIAGAQGQRLSALHECEAETGAAALRACESAWLPGAPDEVMVFKRRGLLLRNDGQPDASLDAYLAAARLAPRDRDVARAVVALSGPDRSDAPTLRARGAALLTLGRPAEAIVSLRDALRLAPDDAGATMHLRIAEGALAARRRSSATVATLPGPPAEAAAQKDAAARKDTAFSNEAPETRSN
jgi:tetratricopeptide (TPR) repeat protein